MINDKIKCTSLHCYSSNAFSSLQVRSMTHKGTLRELSSQCPSEICKLAEVAFYRFRFLVCLLQLSSTDEKSGRVIFQYNFSFTKM